MPEQPKMSVMRQLALNPNPYNRPARMTDQEKEVFQRIADAGAAGAASVTRAERNILFRRPPPEEEDRLCTDKVGLTMPELRAKAIANLDSLSEAECKIITRGADHDSRDYSHNPFWNLQLPSEEKELLEKVWDLVYSGEEQEQEALRVARERNDAVFLPEKLETKKRKRQEAERQRDRLEREGTPKWVNEIKDAGLPRHGFVIFRTAYGQAMDAGWRNLISIYESTREFHLGTCWRRSSSIASKHRPVWVGGDDDAASLDGADVTTLRRRFRTMREQGDIPDRIATDCFLLVDKSTLSQQVVASRTTYQPQRPDPWETTPFVRAIDPDHDESVPVPTEGDLAGFTGEIFIPLPKVFDWLYYCFFAKSEDWNTRYRATRSGPAELPVSLVHSHHP